MQNKPDPESPDPAAREGGGGAGLVVRSARQDDGADLWRMTKAAGTLDLNSPYAYLMVGRHFGATCAVAEKDREPGGFVTAYRLPETPHVLFVWQVAVLPSLRRHGMAKRMILDILARPAASGVTHIHTTVTPSNAPSIALFESVARELDAPLDVTTGFRAEEFPAEAPGEAHEEENLFVIGPFTPRAS